MAGAVGGGRWDWIRGGPTAIVGLDVVAVVAAPVWQHYFTYDSTIPLQVGAGVIAVVTFLGVWLLQRKAGAGRADTNSMRDAIAAGFVLTYLVSVGWAAFYGFFQVPPKESDLTQTLVDNFTVLTGVVVGGYFGADVIKQVTHIRALQASQPAPSKPDQRPEAG